jgi:uncharacterized membrane protein YfhO
VARRDRRQPGTLLRAQLTFMAVPVAAGAHHVDLRFVPPLWLRFVDRTSQLACLALVLAAPVVWWRSATARGTSRR